MRRPSSRTTTAPAALLAIALATPVHHAAGQPSPSGPPPEAKGWRAVTVAEGVEQPWALTWLTDGRPLVTAKRGSVYVVEDGKFVELPVDDLPPVFSGGQGALMDVALHPKAPADPRIYFTMSTGTMEQNRTILVRGILDGDRIRDVETLFEVEPPKSGGQHFGSRLLWLPDGTLLMSVGDGGNPPLEVGGMLARDQAQNLGTHLGSVLRLTEDGKPAPDNPFRDREGAKPEIWTYGHRNIQGLTRDPGSGRIYASEHAARGGDEVNLLEAGSNYGWPKVSLSRDYRTGEPIGVPTLPGMVDPLVVWVPAHAPSGLAFYTGDRFPAWRGSLFSGGLASHDIRRIALDADGRVVGLERLDIGSRVRDVRQGPDGYLYALTDEKNGRLLRIEPESGS